MNGLLVVDKPSGMTSHDVVNRVRRITNERSVGHIGTLDPMATGVLPLVLGKLTRLAQFYTGSDKTYEGEIRLGFATDTYDAEGETCGPVCSTVKVSLEDIGAVAREFTGRINQLPPPFSAKKIAGVAAYKLARNKKDVNLDPVEIDIRRFDIYSVNEDRVAFGADVSSGTYIRSLAHDMGKRLGLGAHLSSLRRTKAGEFGVADAHSLEELEAAVKAGNLESLLVHPRRLLPDMPCVTATEETAAMIRNGRAVNLPEMSRARQVKVFRGQRELVAIATRIAGTLFHPKVVFAAE